MKTAIIQLNATDNKDNNLKKAVVLVRQAISKKAKFILLPEVFLYRGKAQKGNLVALADRVPGPTLKPLMELAKTHRVHILAGSILEKTTNKTKVYNTSVLIDPRGNIKAKYRKINLFEATVGNKKVREANNLLKGKKTVLTKVGGFSVGLSICYDVRFPELYKRYADKGAHVFCVPASFTHLTGKAHWKSLLRARAIENLCYVLAPNQVGKDGKGIVTHGHSMIISPWGEVLAEGSETKEEILYTTLDMVYLKKRRESLSR